LIELEKAIQLNPYTEFGSIIRFGNAQRATQEEKMNRFTPILFVVFFLSSALEARAQHFILGFDCPAEIRGSPGEIKTIDVYATLTSSAPTEFGVEGWQIGVTAEGDAAIKFRDLNGDPSDDPGDAKYSSRGLPGLPLDINTKFDHDNDPDTASIYSTMDLGGVGFNKTFAAEHPDDGRKGLVSAVVITELGGLRSRTLAPNGTQRILRITVEVAIPQEGIVPLTFKYEDGFQGPGVPIHNVITYQNESIMLEDGLTLADGVTLLNGEGNFDLAIVPPGGIPAPDGGDTRTQVMVPPDSPSIHELDVILRSGNLLEGAGLDGWQLSLALDPCPGTSLRYYNSSQPGRKIPDNVSDHPGDAENMGKGFDIATLFDHDSDAMTPALEETVDLAVAGFNQTFDATSDYSLPPPPLDLPPGLRGMVSAVVLTELGAPEGRTLIANHRDVLLKVLVEMPPVALGETKECRIYFQDFMKGPGIPVENLLTYGGMARNPTRTQGLLLGVTGGRPSDFRRGDTNDDGTYDIADAIRLIHDPRVVPGLGGLEIACRDAADVNADGLLNLADAVYLIFWQFQVIEGSPPPPPPHPECGLTEETTQESCPPGSVSQCPL